MLLVVAINADNLYQFRVERYLWVVYVGVGQFHLVMPDQLYPVSFLNYRKPASFALTASLYF